MMPPCSCAVPGRKPGTSTKVTSGMLKASQNRTKRAPLTEALMSSAPARMRGWLPTILGGIDVERPGEDARLVADDPDHLPSEPGKADHEVLGEVLLDLHEAAL